MGEQPCGAPESSLARTVRAMLGVIGLVVSIVMVFGGYIMAGGHLSVARLAP